MSPETQKNMIRSMILNINAGNLAAADKNLKELQEYKVRTALQKEYDAVSSKMKENK